MEPALIISLLGLAVNAIIAVFVIIGFFWRFATKDDIKRLETRMSQLETRVGNVEARQTALEARQTALETGQAALETRFDRLEDKILVVENKADTSLELHHAVRGDLKVLQASVNRLESYFETPKLKSS